MLKIGNAQAFWGDRSDAAANLLEQEPELDFITLDYLSELSMSIMAVQREKEPQAGYARDFLEVIRSLIPFWKKGSKVKVIANAGGLNPMECARACQRLLQEEHGPQLRIGVVSGDDVLSQLKAHPNEDGFKNLDTSEPIKNVIKTLVTANAYLGAKPIVDALKQGVNIVITGRVTDSSLTLAPCIAYYGWKWDDYNLLAAGTIAGHLLECGTQVTGGISTNWLTLLDIANIGFPFVEMNEDGSFVITKPKHTGGVVSIETVKEQLLYEIGDPDKYLTPDVIASFLSLKLEVVGENRIKVTGAKGYAPPTMLKVSASFQDGYKMDGMLALYGQNVHRKAYICGEILHKQLKKKGYELEKFNIECMGCGDLVPGIVCDRICSEVECILRICACDHRKEALEHLSKSMASLVTSGPQGTTGYTGGRPSIRPVYQYWPCLILSKLVIPNVQVL